MNFCSGCGHQIHETTISCTQCGTVHQAAVARYHAAVASASSAWVPVLALVCGLMATAAWLRPAALSADEAMGVCLFAAVASVLGVSGWAQYQRWRGMLAAGVALGAMGFLRVLSAMVA